MGTSSVRVLGRIYKIARKRAKGLWGKCDNVAGIVTVVPAIDPFSEKDTILHEIMHAILFQQNNHKPEDYALEESFVRPLATGIIAVLQDNPQLAQWLIAPIKE